MIAPENPSAESRPDAWEAFGVDDRPGAGEALIVDVSGYEGPLDLLLALARTQKVDLSKISVLALADQYLGFVAQAAQLKLELAADYLVMAAWLAFLKSRLLLPREDAGDDHLSAEEMANRLAFRLLRLDAMRSAVMQLLGRKRLGRDTFGRGMREEVTTVRDRRYSAQIFDLMQAYAEQRARTIKHVHVVKARAVWSIKDARKRLEVMIGHDVEAWLELDRFLAEFLANPEAEATLRASSFGATLEMARDGVVEIRQDQHFAPIYVRKRGGGAAWERLD